ncbi:MAG: hypothetical protein ACREIC_25575, partial [Limisphaerales bacterium]
RNMNALKVSERPGSVLSWLAVIIALICLSGCATQHAQRDASPWMYNPNTGYPAVGQTAIGS